jgi:hypothetical protein
MIWTVGILLGDMAGKFLRYMYMPSPLAVECRMIITTLWNLIHPVLHPGAHGDLDG